MERHLFLSVILLLATVACAATPPKPDTKAAARSADLRLALDYLAQKSDRFHLKDPAKQLRLKREKRDLLGFRHLRFEQVHEGVALWGREILVHINRSGEVYRATGEAVENLGKQASQPQLNQEQIAAKALQVMPGGENLWKVKQSKLYFYSSWQTKSEPQLVYQVELHHGLIRQFVLLDADDGNLLKRIAGTPSEH